MFKKMKQIISFVMMSVLLLTGLPLTSITLADDIVTEASVGPQTESAEAKAEVQTEAETQPQAEPPAEQDAQPVAQAPAQNEAKPQAEAQPKAEKNANANANANVNAQPKAEKAPAAKPQKETAPLKGANYSESAPLKNGEKVSAADVEGSSGMQESLTLLMQDAGLSYEAANTVLTSIYSAPKLADAPAETKPALPIEDKGNRVDSITVHWLTEDTEENGDDALLRLVPKEPDPLTMHLQVNYSLSGQYNYEPGTIKITIPAQIFHKRDGKLTGNMIMPYPEDPATSGVFNWKREGEYYVLTNTKQLSAATTGYMQFGVSSIYPYEIKDMNGGIGDTDPSGESDPFRASIEVITANGNLIGQTSDPVSAQIDTCAIVKDAYKNAYTKPECVSKKDVPQALRTDDTEENYVKIIWYGYATVEASGLYNLTVTDVPEDTYICKMRKNTFNVNEWYKDGQTEFYQFETYYPLSQFEPNKDYVIHNTVNFDLEEYDNPETDSKKTHSDATAAVSFSWSNPQWNESEPHYNIIKSGNDGKKHDNLTRHLEDSTERSDLHVNREGYYGIYSSALNDLSDGKSVDLSYTIESSGQVLSQTFVSDSSEHAEQKLSNYFKKDVMMVSTEEGMHFGSSTSTELQPITDYEFQSVEFTEPIVYTAVAQNLNENGEIVMNQPGDATFVYQEDPDKSHWPKIQLQILRNNGWEPWATADWSEGKLQVMLHYRNDELSNSAVVSVPGGEVKSFRTVVTLGGDSSKKNAGIDYAVRPVIRLKATDTVKKVVDQAFKASDAPSQSAVNHASLQVFQNFEEAQEEELNEKLWKDGVDSLRGYTTEVSIEPEKTAIQDETDDVDTLNKTTTIHYQAKVHEKTVIHEKRTYEEAIEENRITYEKSGTWYDLLPLGVVPKLDTIKLRKGDTVQDVQMIPNFRKSGRIMLIVKVKLAVQPEKYKEGNMFYYEDVPTISFDATYDFTSENDYGSDVHNVIAFESGNDHLGEVTKYSGEPDDPDGYEDETADHSAGNQNTKTQSAFAGDEKALMKDLNAKSDLPNFAYAGNTLNIKRVRESQAGLNKMVQVHNSGVWTDGLGKVRNDFNTAYTGGLYQYRLHMLSQEETTTKDIVLFDVLENFKPIDDENFGEDVGPDVKRWEGTLLDVDVQQLIASGCAPVIYFSEKPKDEIVLEDGKIKETLNPNYVNPATQKVDLKNSGDWIEASEYMKDHANLSAVTAIAVDASKRPNGSAFELLPNESLSVLVTMRAPDIQEANTEAFAYNNVYMHATTVNGNSSSTRLIHQDYTKVGLQDYNLHVKKVWDDDNDRDHKRPDHVNVTVYQDDEEFARITLDAEHNFSADISKVPLVHPDDGIPYHYLFVEDEVEGYQPSISMNGDQVVITNIHEPDTVTISGTKTWIGDEGREDKRPDFITVKLYADGKYQQEMAVRAPWTYAFKNLIKNKKDGTPIVYTIKEELDENSSYLSEITKTDEDRFDIVNTYHPYGRLEVTKKVENTDPEKTPSAAEKAFPLTFTFYRTGADNKVIPVYDAFRYVIQNENGEIVKEGEAKTGGDPVEIQGGQTIVFEELPENLHYQIEESQLPGFYLKSSSRLNDVVLPNDTVQAELTNVYDATGEITLQANKITQGREPDRSEFRFEVREKLADGSMKPVRTASNGDAVKEEDGSYSAPVNFGTIRYEIKDVGVHTYQIREVIPSEANGYTYDETVHEIEVKVADNGEGKLETTVSGMDENGLTFTNVYSATGSVSLLAWKTLESRVLKDEEFSFALYDAKGEPVKDENGQAITATNEANGIIRFAPLHFDQDDSGKTFYYMIKEVKGTDPSVEYDLESAYGYKLDVIDNGDGTLTIQTTNVKPVFNEDGEPAPVENWETEYVPPVFNNKLKPGFLNVTKNVTDSEGADPAQEFRFKIRLRGENLPDNYNLKYDLTSKKPQTADPSAAPVAETGRSDLPALQRKSASAASEKKASTLSWWEKLLGVVEVRADDEDLSLPVSDNYEGMDWQITAEGVLILGKEGADDQHLKGGNARIKHTPRKPATKDEPEQLEQPSSWPWHKYHDQITEVKVVGTVTVDAGVSLYAMFQDIGYGSSNEVKPTIDLTNLNTKYATDMGCMFEQCQLSSINLSTLDTSNVKTMRSMFAKCNVGTLDLSSFNTSNVTSMRSMFQECGASTITFGPNFVTTSVDDMCYMFDNCQNLKSLDLSYFNTSKVQHMHYLFAYCNSLTSIQFGDGETGLFSTAGVQETDNWNGAAGMFTSCTSLKTLDLRNCVLNFPGAKRLWNMFYNCINLENLYLGDSINTSAIEDFSDMFRGCIKLQTLDISGFNTSNAKNMDSMFRNCSNLTTLSLGNTFTVANASAESMFENCEKITSIQFSDMMPQTTVTNTKRSMKSMFKNCPSLQSVLLGNDFNTTNVSDMSDMFNTGGALTTIKAQSANTENNLGSLFNTSSVKSMDRMFYGLTQLPNVNLGNQFTVANASAESMFENCETMTSIQFSDMTTPTTVTNTDRSMENMFKGCSKLESVLLGNDFNTTNVSDMSDMFNTGGSLTTIKAQNTDTENNLGSHFHTSSVSAMDHMFSGNAKLENLNLGQNFKVGEATTMEYMFEGDEELKSVTLPSGFRFNGENSKLPDPKTGENSPYSGKWIQVVDLNVNPRPLTHTAAELAEKFDTSSEYPGTWVWEVPDSYIVDFDANGDGDVIGDMQSRRFKANEDNQITSNGFVRIGGYTFTGWKVKKNDAFLTDDEGADIIYPDEHEIPAGTFQPNEEITLVAQWEKAETSITLNNGEGEFILHANETAHFELPAGMTYQIFEETPEGWTLVEETGTVGTIQPNETQEAKFTNQYHSDTASAQFVGLKTLDGKAPKAGEFDFNLLDADGNTMQTESNTKDGVIQFDRITYTGPGTYTYFIKESIPVLSDGETSDIEYDEHTEKVIVTVTKEDGSLSTNIAYATDEQDPNKGILFENTTKPDPEDSDQPKTGSLLISKTTTNGNAFASLSDKTKDTEFTFTIRLTNERSQPLDSSTEIKVNGEAVSLTNGIFTASCKANETITISDLPIGTNYYVEEGSVPAGWKKNTDPQEGTVAAGETAVTFSNTYAAKGEITLHAHKQLEGRTLKADEFAFGLYEDPDAEPLQTMRNEALDTAETNRFYNEQKEKVETVDNPWFNTAPVNFEELKFSEGDIGTKTYYIREMEGEDASVNYDDTVCKVMVTIEDAGNGRLSVTADYDTQNESEPLFVNTVKGGSLSIQKQTLFATEEAKDAEFPFLVTLKDPSGKELSGTYEFTNGNKGGTLKSGETVQLKGGETLTIENIPDGTTYQVKEVSNTENGWKLTESSNDAGTIAAGKTSESTFTNSYRTKGSVTIEASKRFVGGTLSDHTFQFELLDESETPVAYAQSDAEGNITFDAIPLGNEHAGNRLTYYVHEIPNANDPTIQYDPELHEVTVDVKDNGKGELSAVVNYPEGGIILTNFAQSLLKNLSVTKEVTGSYGSRSTEFHFTLTLTNPEGEETFHPVTWRKGSQRGTITEEGATEFTLAHNETITFSGIMEGTGYQVSEEEYGRNGYDTTISGVEPDGETAAGVLNDDTAVTFTNHREMDTPTGVHFGIFGGIFLILLAASGLSLLMLLRLRRRNDGR